MKVLPAGVTLVGFSASFMPCLTPSKWLLSFWVGLEGYSHSPGPPLLSYVIDDKLFPLLGAPITKGLLPLTAYAQ